MFKRSFASSLALALSLTAAAFTVQADNEQYFPLQSYRVGPYAAGGTGFFGGFIDYLSFGGSEMGRGVRAQRYVGKVKGYLQNELRWRFVQWEMFGQPGAASTNAFVDAGVIGTELGAPHAFDGQPPLGFGGALLLHWNENFILRLDIGTSAVERYPTSVYIQLGQTF